MSNSTTIVTTRQSDGTVVQVLPDGTTRPLTEKTDWKRLRAMTPEEVEAAARSDPDNPPLTDANLSA
jgi:putative transcriptional regulator